MGQNYRQAKKLLKHQAAWDAIAREENYNYGEQAADAAHERSIALYDYQKEQESLSNQIAEAQEAGVSPGLVIGGGTGGGSGSTKGAQGDGAGAINGIDIAALASVDNERKALSIEGMRTAAETAQGYAEAKKTKAETEKIKAETNTENETRDVLIEELKQRGMGQWMDNMEKYVMGMGRNWKGEGNEYNANVEFENKIYGFFGIHEDSITSKKQREELANLVANTNNVEALTQLNTEKKKILWEELLVAQKKNDNDEIRAKAVALAAQWSTGEYTNWKTWTQLAEDLTGGIKNIIGLAK